MIVKLRGDSLKATLNAYQRAMEIADSDPVLGLEWNSRTEKREWVFENLTNAKIHYHDKPYDNDHYWRTLEFATEEDYLAFLLRWS